MSTFLSRLLIAGVLLAGAVAAQPILHLKSRDIRAGEQAEIPAVAVRLQGGRLHRLIQFSAAPTPDQLAELERRGARIQSYVPDHGFLVSTSAGTDLDGLELVYDAPLAAADKLSPRLPAEADDGQPRYSLVQFHGDIAPAAARALALDQGLEIRDHSNLQQRDLLLAGTMAQLRAIAVFDEVAYIYPASSDLIGGWPVHACAGALTATGIVSQIVARFGEGWDGPGRGSADLRYGLGTITGKLSATDVHSEVARAMAEWTRYARISLTQTTALNGPRTLAVLFAARAHGDDYPFDGPSRGLAHTFYPAPPNPEPIAGDLHLDEEEDWHIGADTDLYSVVLHELGHALGLGHSDQPGAVMYPYYRGLAGGLTAEDIGALLDLYAAQATTPDSGALAVSIESPSTSPYNTTASALAISGATSGGQGDAQITWLSDRGVSGTASTTPGSRIWTIASMPLGPGPNTVTVSARDSAQALASAVVMIVRAADASPPLLLIANPPEGAVFETASPNLVLTGTAWHSSGIARVAWFSSAGGSGAANGGTTWSAGPIPLRPESNRIAITAWSVAGTSTTKWVSVNYRIAVRDTTAPALAILMPAMTSVTTTATSVTFSGTARDSGGLASVTWSTSAGQSGLAEGTANWKARISLVAGINTVIVRAQDVAGNSAWRAVTVTRK